MDKDIIKVTTDLVNTIIENTLYELVEVEYTKEDGEWYLRVYLDKPGGITINDCATVSRRLSKMLDKVDPIEESYFLEVSSPGIDRVRKN